MNRNIRKRLGSILLCMAMLMSFLSVTAEAASTDNCSGECNHVAAIGNTHYDTLVEAVEAAQNGDTVELLRTSEGSGIKIDTSKKSLVFDLRGNTYTVTEPTVGSTGTETNAFQLLKGGSITFKNGTLKAGSLAKILIQNYCNLTLEDVTVDCRESSQCQYASSNNHGNIIMKGNTNIYAAPGQMAFDVWYNLGGNYSDGVSVTIDKSMTGEINGTIEYGASSVNGEESSWTKKAQLIIEGGNFVGSFAESSSNFNGQTPNIVITGGTFSTDVSAYVPAGYECAGPDGTGRYTVKQLESKLVVEGSVDTSGNVTGSLDGAVGDNGAAVGDKTGEGIDGSGTEQVSKDVSISLTTAGGNAATTILTVPKTTAESLNKANSLTVQTDAADVTFDSAALDKIATANGEVTIQVTENTASSDDGDLASYTVTAKADGTDLLPFTGTGNGTVTITVQKPEVGEGQTLQAWYVDGDKYVQQLELTDAGDGKVAIEIDHLSTVVLRGTEPATTYEAYYNGNYYTTIGEALTAANNGSGGLVQLLKDATLTGSAAPWYIGKNITLDLGGDNTLTYASGYGFAVSPTFHFTIQNGTYENIADSANLPVGIEATKNYPTTDGHEIIGCTVTIRNATIIASYACIYSQGYATIEVYDSELISTSESAIYGLGPNNKVTVERSTITGGAHGVYQKAYETQYDNMFPASTFIIQNSTIEATDGAAVYIASNEGIAQNVHTLTVTDSEITGPSGIEVQGTVATISGEKTEVTATDPNGAALAVTSQSNEETEGSMTVDGGTFIGSVGVEGTGSATLTVSGGQFSESVDEEYLDEDLTAELKSASNSVAPFSYFTSMADTLNAAKPGDTVKAVNVVEGTATYTVTLNYNDGATAGITYQVTADTEIPLPTATRSGYTFLGWYDGNTKVSSPYAVNNSVTLVAQWQLTPTTTPDTGSSSDKDDDDDDDGYSITIPASSSIRGGSITASPRSADKGDTVTITVTPDEGYELDTLTVTDSKGSELTLTNKGNDRYTFTMPASDVKIQVSFRETAAPAVNPFIDVSASAYYYDAVLWAMENGITNGTTATAFSPNATVTRAQMVTFLWRAHGAPRADGGNPFTDVSSNAYYYDAVLWAVASGITNGTTATTFSPDAPVTRAQAVTFQWRTAGSPVVSGESFGDVAADAYYAGAVTWAVANGITNGTAAATFSPDAPVSRAQAVTFLYRELA